MNKTSELSNWAKGQIPKTTCKMKREQHKGRQSVECQKGNFLI
jgi:hypothetical protein